MSTRFEIDFEVMVAALHLADVEISGVYGPGKLFKYIKNSL